MNESLTYVTICALIVISIYSAIIALVNHNMNLIELAARAVLSVSSASATLNISSESAVTYFNFTVILVSVAVLAVNSAYQNRKLLFSRFHLFRKS